MYLIIYNLKIIAISVHTNDYLLFNIFIKIKKPKNLCFYIPLVKLVLILIVINFLFIKEVSQRYNSLTLQLHFNISYNSNNPNII